jgi:hypothetical protein
MEPTTANETISREEKYKKESKHMVRQNKKIEKEQYVVKPFCLTIKPYKKDKYSSNKPKSTNKLRPSTKNSRIDKIPITDRVNRD